MISRGPFSPQQFCDSMLKLSTDTVSHSFPNCSQETSDELWQRVFENARNLVFHREHLNLLFFD